MLVEFQLSLFSEGLNVVELFCPFVTCRLTHLSVFLVKTNTFECCSPVPIFWVNRPGVLEACLVWFLVWRRQSPSWLQLPPGACPSGLSIRLVLLELFVLGCCSPVQISDAGGRMAELA